MLFFFYGLSFFSLGLYTNHTPQSQVKGASAQNTRKEKLDRPMPYADVQAAQIISDSVKFCANTNKGFELAYPNNWFTTYNKEEEKCKYFAPYSFVIPEYADKSFVPIQVDPLTLDEWASTVSFFEAPNDYENVISSETVQINDRLVKKIKLSATGNGSDAQGFVQIVYLVFDASTPLQIKYQQLDQNEETQKMEDIVGAFVKSLKYFWTLETFT